MKTSQTRRLDFLESAGVTVLRFNGVSEIPDLLWGLKFVAIFHLATFYLQSHVLGDIRNLVHANIEFGTVLLESVSKQTALFISAESYFQFRNLEREPISLYAALKSAFSVLANFYCQAAKVPLVEVVLYDTYGPGDTRAKLIPALVKACVNEEPITLGPENQPVNLVYIRDVVKGLVSLAEAQRSGRFQIRAPQNTTVGEIAALMASQVSSVPQVHFSDANPINNHVNETGTWDNPPGWKAETPLNEGLRACLISELESQTRDPV
jgi:nucleoside-diphosphate-sugar epimerase